MTVTDDGTPVSVVQAAGAGSRLDQGFGWAGNFSPGDELYWTGTPGGGPVTLFFTGPALSAVGMNIQADFFGPFTALIEVFDGGMTLLGSHVVPGLSSGAGDGSAIFLGVSSTDASTDFVNVRISLTSAAADPADFAINQVDIAYRGGEIPEPASLVIFGVGALGLAASRWSRRKRQ